MSAPLSNYTMEEMQAEICFLSSEMICKMQQQYGESCLESGSKIYKWFDHFKVDHRRTGLSIIIKKCDDQQKGTPFTTKKTYNIEVINQMIHGNHWINSLDEVESGSIVLFIHMIFNFFNPLKE